MSYNVPDYDESYERRLADEEAEESALDEFLDSLDADPMTAYKQQVEEPED